MTDKDNLIQLIEDALFLLDKAGPNRLLIDPNEYYAKLEELYKKCGYREEG